MTLSTCVRCCLRCATFALVLGTLGWAGLAPRSVEAGWHHRHGCGSSGTCGHGHCRCRHHGSGGSHGSSGGSWGGSHGGSTGGAPAKAVAPAAPAKTVESVPADGSRLIVELPAAATLVINGQQTTSVGDTRTFAGNALAEDKKYEYKLAIAIDGPDGREEYTRTVWLTAGRTETVSFHAAVAETARKRAAAIAAAREAQDTPETAAAPTDLTAR